MQMQDKIVTGMVCIMDQRMDFGNPSKGYYDITTVPIPDIRSLWVVSLVTRWYPRFLQ